MDSCDDHRVAMALAVAGLAAHSKTTVSGAEAAQVLFPEFWEEMSAIVMPD